MIDYEKIDDSIEEFVARVRQDRLERGLPAEPPEPFVPIPLSMILAERCQPFLGVIVKYTQIINGSGEVFPLDISKLEKYRSDAELLSMSLGLGCMSYGTFVLECLRYLNEINSALVIGEKLDSDVIVRRLYLNIAIANAYTHRHDAEFPDNANTKEDYENHSRHIREEIKRLTADEALLEAEVTKFREQYEAIRHLI